MLRILRARVPSLHPPQGLDHTLTIKEVFLRLYPLRP